MTAVEKAREFIDKYRTHIRSEDSYIYLDSDDELHLANKCSLVAVDEIIELLYSLKFGNSLSEEIEYYEQVKQELNK